MEKKTFKEIYKENKSKPPTKGAKILGFAMVFILLVCLVKCFSTSKKVEQNDGECANAYVIAKPIIKASLDVPESASFPFSDFHCQNQGDSIYEIHSYVECKNLYNVSLKKNYQIILKYIGGSPADNTNWQLIKINFLN
jgi:hypothetical protein